ncbi:MAG: VWA domain-containing protein [Bacteroidota bacterium]
MEYKELLNINWEEFHFLRPEWLWAFVPFVVILVLMIFVKNKEHKWQENIATHLRQFVIVNHNDKNIWLNRFLFVLFFSILIIAMSGPSWKMIEKPGTKTKSVFYIVLDISQSMLAKDLQPNRLERAKFKIKDLFKENPHSSTGLIVYEGTAHLVVPATNDYSIIEEYLNPLSPKILYVKGSNLPLAIELADSITPGDSPLSLFVLTDSPGNNDYNAIREFCSNEKHNFFLMPLATIAGANVPAFRGKGTLKDIKGEPVHSKLNASVIKNISSIENCDVVPMVLDNTDVKLIAEKVKAQKEFLKDEKNEEDWQDSGILLMPVILILSLFWFRKGFSLLPVILLFFSSCNDIETFDDLWYTKDYQGQMREEEGEFNDAATKYTESIRKGSAYYKDGNYSLAIEQFSQDTTAMASYNLGLAHMQAGNYNEALMAFETAYAKDSTLTMAKDSEKLLQNWMNDNLPKARLDSLKKINEKGRGKPKNKDESLDDANQEVKEKPKDMENRLSDETESNIRKAKESEDMPMEIDNKKKQNQDARKMLIRKISADPETFLKRKFQYQQRKYYKNVDQGEEIW